MLILVVKELKSEIFRKKTMIGLALTIACLFIIYYAPIPRIILTYGARFPFLIFWCIPLYESSKNPNTLKL